MPPGVVCGLRSGSARGRIFYPDSVAGAAPEGGPCQRSRRRGWTVGPSAPPEPVVGFTRPEPAQECTVGLGCVGTGAVDLTIQSDRTSAAVKSGRIVDRWPGQHRQDAPPQGGVCCLLCRAFLASALASAFGWAARRDDGPVIGMIRFLLGASRVGPTPLSGFTGL